MATKSGGCYAVCANFARLFVVMCAHSHYELAKEIRGFLDCAVIQPLSISIEKRRGNKKF